MSNNDIVERVETLKRRRGVLADEAVLQQRSAFAVQYLAAVPNTSGPCEVPACSESDHWSGNPIQHLVAAAIAVSDGKFARTKNAGLPFTKVSHTPTPIWTLSNVPQVGDRSAKLQCQVSTST